MFWNFIKHELSSISLPILKVIDKLLTIVAKHAYKVCKLLVLLATILFAFGWLLGKVPGWLFALVLFLFGILIKKHLIRLLAIVIFLANIHASLPQWVFWPAVIFIIGFSIFRKFTIYCENLEDERKEEASEEYDSD